MHILHTEWSDGWGGQEKRIYTEMLGMRARGHEVTLATRSSCQLGVRAADAGIPVVHLPFCGKFDFGSVRQLRKLIRNEEIDVVNTHSGIDSWVGGMAARLAGCVLVRTRHLNIPLKRNWHNFVHFLPQRIVTCGEEMRNTLICSQDFPSAQLASIPTGIDFSTFRASQPRSTVRAALGIAENAFLILMVAVIRSVKRHEVAIRAFQRFQATVPDAVLVLAGEGPLAAVMQQLCEELCVADSVRFLGHRDDIPDLMQAADMLLLTSRSEGVPQAVTQGLGMGLPVLATAVGGVPELVIDGETGLLAPAEDIKALATGMAHLHDDVALRARLGAAGHTHALAHYSIEAMLDATEKLYADILADR
jgi:glycosyltransferase involved in cell wall biosynthesis